MGNRFPEKWKLGKNPIMFQHFKEVMARPKGARVKLEINRLHWKHIPHYGITNQ